MKRRPNLFNAFRRDRLAGLWLAALLLFVPYVQPLSEALAAGKPFFSGEICSTFGTSGKAALPALVDDCAVCIANTHTPQVAALPADFTGIAALAGSDASAAFSADRSAPPAPSKLWIAPPGQGPPSFS